MIKQVMDILKMSMQEKDLASIKSNILTVKCRLFNDGISSVLNINSPGLKSWAIDTFKLFLLQSLFVRVIQQ